MTGELGLQRVRSDKFVDGGIRVFENYDNIFGLKGSKESTSTFSQTDTSIQSILPTTTSPRRQTVIN